MDDLVLVLGWVGYATPAHKLRLKFASRCIDPVKSCSCYKGDDVAMSEIVAEDIKRWTAKRKSALVIEIMQGSWRDRGRSAAA